MWIELNSKIISLPSDADGYYSVDQDTKSAGSLRPYVIQVCYKDRIIDTIYYEDESVRDEDFSLIRSKLGIDSDDRKPKHG